MSPWLTRVTVLTCLCEMALVALVFGPFRDGLAWSTARLGALVTELSEVTEQRWGLQLFTGRLLEIPISMSQLWMTMVIALAMALLLGVIILVRRITRHVLDANFTSSAEFRQRKAATQDRLDHLLR